MNEEGRAAFFAARTGKFLADCKRAPDAMLHLRKAEYRRRRYIPGMSTSPVINSLRCKRAEVAGLIREADAGAHELRRDLQHIDATLKMFAPASEPCLIKPVRPYRPGNRIFEPKELAVRITTSLREAECVALTVDAIGDRIMADKGLKEPA